MVYTDILFYIAKILRNNCMILDQKSAYNFISRLKSCSFWLRATLLLHYILPGLCFCVLLSMLYDQFVAQDIPRKFLFC